MLIETQNTKILIDPGNITYEAKVFDKQSLSKLDYLLITHEHADHCHIPFIKDLVAAFPTVTIMSNPSVVQLLAKENITVQTEGNNFIELTPVPHERVFDNKAPSNVQFDIFNLLTHPGDSMSFTKTKKILALPLLGPSWMITQAAEKALALKPQFVIPIHDWHWKEHVRKTYYERLDQFFSAHNITFTSFESGESVLIQE